jgi:hypothetical protein
MPGDFAQQIAPVFFNPTQLRGGALDVGLCYGNT